MPASVRETGEGFPDASSKPTADSNTIRCIERTTPKSVEARGMADENEEEEAPAVELGEGESVEGAPLARVASRLSWGMEKSEVVRKEGESVIRTPEGPRELSGVLESVDESYFSTRNEFEDAVREVVGTGAVPTSE